MALSIRTKFQLEILTSTISGILKFRENILESSRNLSVEFQNIRLSNKDFSVEIQRIPMASHVGSPSEIWGINII